jgi:hypothetical protein
VSIDDKALGWKNETEIIPLDTYYDSEEESVEVK